ncbi:MAG: VWA domain-containing protein [Myxococcales bacterium]|nr:VWA domain-containing protein [Myxococcales bacterium]
MSRLTLSTSLSLALAAMTACNAHPLKEVQYESSSNTEVSVIEPNRDVDVLFVIDNSGSMAEKQALLAENFEAFVAELDLVDANYRIGVVTTDVGNPRDPEVTVEGGDLRLSSCRDRIDDFNYYGFDAAFACTDHCQRADADLEIRPTETGLVEGIGEAAPRLWLERLYSETNLGGGVSIAEAFQCFGPQGITGADTEAPLEAMRQALAKASDRGSANFGFLRPHAHLAVVFITDEVDCSFNPDLSEIFRDNTTFWSDPDKPIPTSAVCWNAGTTCKGPGPVYEGCEPADYDVTGALAGSADDAVLFPVDRYVDFLEGLLDSKEGGAKVMVAALAGVPGGFTDGAPIPYADAASPDYQAMYGIGPGCTFADDPTGSSPASPPVRLRELAEAFPIDAQSDFPGLYSICEDDYSPALRDIAEQVKAQFTPGCIDACVKDTHPATARLDTDCVVFETDLGGRDRVDLEECDFADGAWTTPDGVDVCFALLTDAGGVTPELDDDMTLDPLTSAPACAGTGNVEVMLVRTKASAPGRVIKATCSVERYEAALLCPDLD